jgi:cell division protein FtsZ
LLDNVSINGATGVLVNITGGPDLTIEEVTTINSIIQEAAGEEGEMIFGVVHEPQLEGSLRVTVIATGFGEPVEDEELTPLQVESVVHGGAEPVVIGSRYEGPRLLDEVEVGTPAAGSDRGWSDAHEELEDLEIPTFIRRQMD